MEVLSLPKCVVFGMKRPVAAGLKELSWSGEQVVAVVLHWAWQAQHPVRHFGLEREQVALALFAFSDPPSLGPIPESMHLCSSLLVPLG